MEVMDLELRQLVEKAKTQGFLTYADVTPYLPDEDCSSEKLDSLLVMLEQNNIELLDRAPANFKLGLVSEANNECLLEGEADNNIVQNERKGPNSPSPKLSDDPIRLYRIRITEFVR